MGEIIKNRSNSETMGLFSNYIMSCVSGGDKRKVAESIPRLDLTVVGTCFNSVKLIPDQSGFGSPVTVMGGSEQRTSSDGIGFGSPVTVMGGSEHRTSSNDDRRGCSRFLTSFRPAASTILDKQSGSQLTIFYAGTVNVYDKIPADKAQAIMLMATSGNYTSYAHNEVPNGCGSQTQQKISVPVIKLSKASGSQSDPYRKVNTDIPIARKYSLQRFLEKRKDRVNAKAKGPYKTAEPDNPEAHQHPLPS